MSELPLQGSLSDIRLPRLLMSLNRERVEGTLSVACEDITKKIHFKKGEAIFASSNFEDDRLGEMLVKAGKITIEQYDRTVALLKTSGKRQGAILVELGYITPKELFWGVKYQVREIIYSIFHFDRGEFGFQPGQTLQDEVITLKMSIGALIYEGMRRIDNWTRIRKELPPTETVMKLSDDPLSLFQEVELTPQDRKILSLIDGKRTIKQVIEDSWLNNFEAMKTVYVLWSIGIITEKKIDGAAIPLEEIFKPVANSEEILKKRVNDFHARLSRMDRYGLLELPRSATLEDARTNYYRLAKEYHPDRFFDSDDQALKDKLSVIFDAITDAYNSFKKDALRAEEAVFDGAAETNPRQGVSQSDSPVFAPPGERAAEELKKGLDAIKRSELPKAIACFKNAVALDPEKAAYWNYLAFAYSKTVQGFRDAEKSLMEAIRLEPANSDYYANLGLIYLRGKAPDKAKRQFEKALMLDPGNVKARQGLKHIN